jgi:anaerobic magnesium-protoporphyrin IX monomethyl ester cyclase
VLIGFSLIFQFYVRNYGALIELLRAAGIRCHFTMGGHFPSLSYQETLAIIPELDSVVRFEGEQTARW